MSLRTIAASAALIMGLALVPALAFADTNSNCNPNNNWWSWNQNTTNCTAGNVLVYVQVSNNNGATRIPADFTVSVAGLNATPSSFLGSLSGISVKVNGTYSVNVLQQQGYSASYSAGCTGTVVNNESATCIVTESNTAAYNNYPYSYYPNQTYTTYPYSNGYIAPLTCAPTGQTVTIGQNATFTAQGGEFSQFNWKNSFQPNNTSYNIGRSYTLTLNSPGTQTITVMNGSQSATCSVNVVGYPIAGYNYPTYPGTTVYPGGVTLTPTYIPRLPNTGFGPLDSASLAFALVFMFAATIATYPYARKAFAIVLR